MTTAHEIETAPELKELHLEERHDGPGAAAIVAAGVGIFVLGFLTLLSELSESVHEFLGSMDLGLGVGPLAGKTTLASLTFFVVWATVGLVWRNSDPDIKRIFWISLGFGVVGALLTFPPIFTAFG